LKSYHIRAYADEKLHQRVTVRNMSIISIIFSKHVLEMTSFHLLTK